jgi:hypothetical protein
MVAQETPPSASKVLMTRYAIPLADYRQWRVREAQGFRSFSVADSELPKRIEGHLAP